MNAVAAATATADTTAHVVWNTGHHDDNGVGRGDLKDDEVSLDVVVNSGTLANVVYIRNLCVQLNDKSPQSSTM